MNRKATIERKTSETHIKLSLDLDPLQSLENLTPSVENFPINTGITTGINTGSKFLDHMLDIFRKHSGIALFIECQGDTEIDMHHTTEDIAICLGEALFKCLIDKTAIERYGFYYVVMDEALARVTLDLCNRISFVFNSNIQQQQMQIGNLDLELIPHFFETFAQNAKLNLHIDILRGKNAHHCIEACFKALARSLSMAISTSKRIIDIPSTKGSL